MPEESDTFMDYQHKRYTVSQLKQHDILGKFLEGEITLEDAITTLNAIGFPPDDQMLHKMEQYERDFLSQ